MDIISDREWLGSQHCNHQFESTNAAEDTDEDGGDDITMLILLTVLRMITTTTSMMMMTVTNDEPGRQTSLSLLSNAYLIVFRHFFQCLISL